MSETWFTGSQIISSNDSTEAKLDQRFSHLWPNQARFLDKEYVSLFSSQLGNDSFQIPIPYPRNTFHEVISFTLFIFQLLDSKLLFMISIFSNTAHLCVTDGVPLLTYKVHRALFSTSLSNYSNYSRQQWLTILWRLKNKGVGHDYD